MYSLELANSKELEVCYEIIEEGRAFQKEQGFVQWTEAYPNRDTIEADMEKKKGYVIKAQQEILGYMCVDFDGEPAYDDINGAWRSEAPYAVVHRMAFSKKARGQGIADIAFGLIDKLCVAKGVKFIRVDTDFPNKRMQHILKKNGYVYCGTIVFQNGDKLAYDKLL